MSLKEGSAYTQVSHLEKFLNPHLHPQTPSCAEEEQAAPEGRKLWEVIMSRSTSIKSYKCVSIKAKLQASQLFYKSSIQWDPGSKQHTPSCTLHSVIAGHTPTSGTASPASGSALRWWCVA